MENVMGQWRNQRGGLEEGDSCEALWQRKRSRPGEAAELRDRALRPLDITARSWPY